LFSRPACPALAGLPFDGAQGHSRPQSSQRFGLTAEALRTLRIKTFSLAAEKAASENLLTLRGLAYYVLNFAAYLTALFACVRDKSWQTQKLACHAVAEPGFSFLASQQKRKRIFSLRSLRLCGESAVTHLCGLCALCEKIGVVLLHALS